MRIEPKLVLSEAELAFAVNRVSEYDSFVIDIETTFDGPKVNQVHWVGLAVPTGVFMIPMGHPLGRMTKPSTLEKRLPPDSERRVLKNGKLSEAKKEYRIPPTYETPPKQLRPDIVFEALHPLLFSDRRKIGHNVKFDLESLAKYYGEVVPPGPYGDTMLLTHVLDENLINYGLKHLVCEWLRVPTKERADFYPNLGKIGVLTQPIDQVAWYLAKDLWYCLTYWRAHKALLDEKWPILNQALDLEHALLGPLMRMELNGIPVDTEMLTERGDQLAKEIRQIEIDAWTIAGRKFELSNNGHKREVIFGPKEAGGQGLKPLTFTAKTGQPQINQAVLEHYSEKNKLAKLLLEWSEKDKLYSTFITGMGKQLIDGKLHTSFNQHRTVTSRLSSSQPNLQQIPRGDFIRDAFWSEKGWMLVVSDYDQIELRCAAYLSGDPEMIKVFVDGMDIHAEAAASMLQVPVEDVTKDQRQVGKTQNFLTLYGGGADKLARVAGVDKDTALSFIERYYERFDALNEWKHTEVYKAKERGVRGSRTKIPYAEIPPFHRRRRVPDLYSGDHFERSRAERQVVNSIVQGFAASIMKLALIDLDAQLLPGEKLLLNVHDEVIVTAPTPIIGETKDRVVSIMESVKFDGEPILGQVPLAADAKVARRWSEGK